MNRDEAPGQVIDIVLDAPASVSIYLAALARAGRRADVLAVQRAHEAAALAVREELMHNGAWAAETQVGMRAPHSYRLTQVRVEVVPHSGSGDGLHAHLILEGEADRGEVERALPPIRSRYVRALADSLAGDLGVQVTTMRGRFEIPGIPEDLIDRFESHPCRVRAGASQIREMHIAAAR